MLHTAILAIKTMMMIIMMMMRMMDSVSATMHIFVFFLSSIFYAFAYPVYFCRMCIDFGLGVSGNIMVIEQCRRCQSLTQRARQARCGPQPPRHGRAGWRGIGISGVIQVFWGFRVMSVRGCLYMVSVEIFLEDAVSRFGTGGMHSRSRSVSSFLELFVRAPGTKIRALMIRLDWVWGPSVL